VPLDARDLRQRLAERFTAVDFEQAKEDIAPFLKDPRELRLWNAEFFMELVPQLRAGGDADAAGDVASPKEPAATQFLEPR